MIVEFNAPTQIARLITSSVSLQDFKDYIDSLPDGLYWLYVTGPAVKAFTGDSISVTTANCVCIVFKYSKGTHNTLCELHDYADKIPIHILAKKKTTRGIQFLYQELRLFRM